MDFIDRKKQVEKHKRLAKKNKEQIDNHSFVIAKRKLIAKHNMAVNKLLEECTHDEVENKSSYCDGTYYDQAHTDYWQQCVLCGKTMNHRSKSHGYYG